MENVEYVTNKHGKHIDSEKKLILLYWKIFDQVEMDKQSISTTDFLRKSTPSQDIINALIMLESIKETRIM